MFFHNNEGKSGHPSLFFHNNEGCPPEQSPQAGTDSQLNNLAAADTTPSRQAANGELFHEIRRRLSPEERQLADLRAQGHDWATIAAKLGGTAQGRRKQLVRALDRVA